jgi:hypothetical protein
MPFPAVGDLALARRGGPTGLRRRTLPKANGVFVPGEGLGALACGLLSAV